MTGPSFDELDRHPGAEDAGLDRHPELAQRGAEPLVERFGCRRSRGAREARTVAPRGVGDQRELADHQRRAARLEQRAVELPVVVLEDAEPRHLRGEPVGVGVTVAGRDPEEDAEPGPDRAAGRNRRAGHPLDDASHGSSRSRMRAA